MRVIARRLLALAALLETRGHAASAKVDLDDAAGTVPEGGLEPLLKALRPARSHPEWAQAKAGAESGPRAETVEAVAAALREAV